jgi:DNA-binding transcriptional LysR family regulator
MTGADIVAAVNLKNLDLNLLVVFDTVYATRNISRAAEQMALSQPAVSNALSRLRELLGDPLFVRARRGVEPTTRATQIAGTVREALAMIGQQFAPAELDLATYKRHFRVLMADVFEPIVMPPLLRAIADRAPHVTVETIGVFGSDFVRQIREGLLDLAVYVFPPVAQDIVNETLGDSDLVLVARRGHPQIAGKLDLATWRLLPHIVLVPEVRNAITAPTNIAAQRIERREVYAVPRVGAMPPIIERTDLVGLMPRWYFHEMVRNFDVVAHELPVAVPNQPCCISWHAKNTADPGHIWLRETLGAAFRAHLQRGKTVESIDAGRRRLSRRA